MLGRMETLETGASTASAGARKSAASGATLGVSAGSDDVLFCSETHRLHGLSIRPDALSVW